MNELKFRVLKQYFGFDSFRSGQENLIDALTSGRDVLGIMPTGSGKSICYQVPALMKDGVTIVISPLISLMKDQVMALKEAGAKPAYINSSLSEGQCHTVINRASAGQYKIIYVAPERLDTPRFKQFAQQAAIDMVIIDEAHCISQWGQDFRPSYLKIADFVAALPKRPVIGAFTATATSRVRSDISLRLHLQNPLILTTGFDRPNLFFSVVNPRDKNQALINYLQDKNDKSGIIYCSTRKNVEEVCVNLCQNGYNATRYHAGLSDEERRQNQEAFQFDQARIMVATNAFGMGIDKSNVSFVIHYNMPLNLENYYQEAGRAGRDGNPADCILLYEKRDVIIAKWLIEHNSVNEQLSEKEQIEVQKTNLEKLKFMTFYATTKRCLRNEILRYFGEFPKADCGNCLNCRKNMSAASEKGKQVYADTQSKHRDDSVKQKSSRKIELYQSQNQQKILANLTALRNQIVKEEGVPAYILFTNKDLEEISLAQPRTVKDFGAIPGIGNFKKEKYGKRFVACVLSSLETDQKNDFHTTKPTKEKIDSYKPWNEDEDSQLCEEFEQMLSHREIAEIHHRTTGAIHSRLKKLGLLS